MPNSSPEGLPSFLPVSSCGPVVLTVSQLTCFWCYPNFNQWVPTLGFYLFFDSHLLLQSLKLNVSCFLEPYIFISLVFLTTSCSWNQSLLDWILSSRSPGSFLSRSLPIIWSLVSPSHLLNSRRIHGYLPFSPPPIKLQRETTKNSWIHIYLFNS